MVGGDAAEMMTLVRVSSLLIVLLMCVCVSSLSMRSTFPEQASVVAKLNAGIAMRLICVDEWHAPTWLSDRRCSGTWAQSNPTSHKGLSAHTEVDLSH